MFAAETTGRVVGVVDSADGKPIADASVSIQSPSQSLTVTTDATGHFSFVSLVPDTYTLTVHRDGYADAKQADISVQADIAKTESLVLQPALKEIGHVTARSRSSLVQPGVTTDVYSVGPAAQEASRALGGGTDRDSIISSIASVPGVFVPIGQSGWGQSVFIRGGDFNQTGYELDGVPLNRPFDQYSQSPLSSLGASEVQVYTGSAPIDQQAEGIGGYVNEVVKTGTYPGFANADFSIGGPAFYNRASLETGGADGPDRKFTYYVGLQGFDYNQRIFDQSNGAGLLSTLGPIGGIASDGCGVNNSGPCYPNGAYSSYIGGAPIRPNGYTTLPTFLGDEPAGSDREAIANFHFAIPHKHDGERDDVQFLYANSETVYAPNISLADLGSAISTLPAAPYYIDQNYYDGPLNTILTPGGLGSISNSYFAGHDGSGVYDAPLSTTQNDSRTDNFSLAKIAYRHAIGDKAFARVSLYTESSNEIENGIVGVFQPYSNGPVPGDYLVKNLTNGIDANFTDQITPKHLASVDLAQSISTTDREYNYVAGLYPTSPVAVLVNQNDPTGACYGVNGNATAVADCATGAASYGLPAVGPVGPGYALVPSSGSPDLPTASTLTCGTGPCAYYTVSNGGVVSVSNVKPRFTNFSLADHWDVTKKLALDLGLRYDDFFYEMANTDTPANELFVNTFNQLNCISGTSVMAKASATDSCSTLGPGYAPTNLTAASHNLDYQELSPRVAAAFTVNPSNVLRASYGRFVQPAPSSAVQSGFEEAFYPDTNFYANYGFNSPTRDIAPETSNNFDASWEHQFPDQSTSMKVSPFYRTTQNELAEIPLDPKTDFVAYVNGLDRKTAGLELTVKRGDFKKNGFSGILSYTYSHSVATYPTTSTGGSVVTIANQGIQQYNGYTKFCASNPSDSRCPAGGSTAGPCYMAASAVGGSLTMPGASSASCSAGMIANPYWNSAPQALLDPNASYPAYNGPLAAGAGGTSTSFDVPHVATLVMNYRHNRFAATPSFQFEAGGRYGSPIAAQGVAPNTCTASLPGTTVGDPRYSGGAPVGGAAASPYDASSCYGVIPIPDPYTGQFDSIGSFRQPSVLTMNLQMSYDMSPNTTFELTAVNLLFRCFGGTKAPWDTGSVACNYAQATPYVGNFYNPGDSIQQIAQYPYAPVVNPIVQSNTSGPPLPFQLYADVKFRL